MTASPSTSQTSLKPETPRSVPAGRVARGRLAPPPSKSVTHRYLNLALLAGRPLTLERPLLAEDTRLFLAALGRCGWQVEEKEDEVHLEPAEGTPRQSTEGEVEIFCGNAGTMLRFLVASLAALPGSWRLDGTPRLRERPVGPLAAALARLGVRFAWQGREGYPPLSIAGGTLRGGAARLDAGESSQYLSALLMAAQRASAPTAIEVATLTSAPYVEVTLAAIERFGGRVSRPSPGTFEIEPAPLAPPPRLAVEGDWSAACYPAAAAALTRGAVTLTGLDRGSRQGDRGFLDLLGAMGAEIAWRDRRDREVEIRGSDLIGITADLSGMPDQVPTLAALAPFARGVTRIENVAHLRIKESDRLAAMAQELRRLGAEVEEGRDYLTIPGRWHDQSPPADPVTVDPHDDHRIAMSLALVGLRRPGTSISSPGVVAKSYPGFWVDLESLLQ